MIEPDGTMRVAVATSRLLLKSASGQRPVNVGVEKTVRRHGDEHNGCASDYFKARGAPERHSHYDKYRGLHPPYPDAGSREQWASPTPCGCYVCKMRLTECCLVSIY